MLQKTQKKDKRLRKKQKTQKKRTKDSEKGQKTQKKEQKTQIKGKLRVRQKTQKKPTKDSEKEDNTKNIEALYERLKMKVTFEKRKNASPEAIFRKALSNETFVFFKGDFLWQGISLPS